ncbi:lipoyl(octanoyl) transferase LipB [Cellulomonas sp. zg-ZUI199]|uniref:Octanoyltransferase n=1 Tax=Cellulomonas wangleii TaxID=2816956 RepID=A0ABX8D3H8_9CELL|nr:lipoyl(octanoyl) transferase LipB [Cellulomonas wangleii]MBO0925514.1 lipoyl(octanoyl) transferase LipB [Cellulomonas wangleii]QVI61016.1 lipoyl(octanoyl) transferase LipB [Cellulomonas wangleii]
MRVEPLELGTRLQPYVPTWDLQRERHAAVAAGEHEDTLLLVEHEPVYTAGRRTARSDRPVDGTPVVDVDRGGRITWHGPGQLVGYPVVRLAEPVDVVLYVRALEEALIRTCADVGVSAGRVEGRSGVWLPADEPGTSPAPRRARKVAAIGVRVARGTTMHGFALNCTASLDWYARIVPCGIDDADVTTLTAEAGRDVTIAEVAPLVVTHLQESIGPLLAATADRATPVG